MHTNGRKEKPILFSGPMVRAILEGRKTQTRRVVKPQPQSQLARLDAWGAGARNFIINQTAKGRFVFDPEPDGPQNGTGRGEPLLYSLACPYGRIGSQLWVRETWAQPAAGVMSRSHDGSPIFAADYPPNTPTGFGAWRPSIFMPRSLSRITLEITDVRVERLQEISCPDVMAEGSPVPMREHSSPELGLQCVSAKEWYSEGWNKLNAKRGYSWEANPWVWVISFAKR